MKITHVTIGPYPRTFGDPMPVVRATFEDGTVKDLFSFYPDELSFSPQEFIGLTEAETRRLHFTKDRDYLRS